MRDEIIRVLLIEDDEDDYFLVKTMLTEIPWAEYLLEWASDYEQGLAMLCQKDFEVCLLDYQLGSRNGMELLREAIGNNCDIPIILLTGQGSENVDFEAMIAGAADYLTKDWINKHQLERSIRYSMVHKRRELAERALRNSEGLAAMGRALSSVAHDIKTPLIAIGGFTQLVYGHLDNQGDKEKLEIVLRETARLERMVQDMLEFSRPLELHKLPENPCEIVNETLSIVERIAIEKGVALKAQFQQCDNVICIDSNRMKQVLINLLMNAIQASPKGNTVKINLHGLNRNLIIDIVDYGCGIPLENRPDIFSPFYTTKKEGTGLGLPIVKKIIDAHDGCVEVIDNHERGMTFRVVLPIAA